MQRVDTVMGLDADVNHNPLSGETPDEGEKNEHKTGTKTPGYAKRTARRARSVHRMTSVFEDVDLDTMYNDENEIVE
ncbi:hypothetical protein STCU_11575 [Strigomonas culicis]|uniref:Uncharacterized protein n=1 Tax=Strigomonas culicis TaxID=28005 RepID=S9UN08_9TRYP|nr:hypothetical protein STCU_11575 [Strigomonas culicis]|eukprot:EPY16066.1 hypothetical protein STCU_11575 [Strigomonas culicis]